MTYEAEEVQATVAILGAVEALQDNIVFVELPLLDRDVNANNILPDNASGTDVKVTYKTNGHKRRCSQGTGEDVCAMNETLTQLPSCP